MLNEQYRMHEQIMGYSSNIFYAGKMQAAPSVAKHLLFPGDQPLVFIDTAGCGYEEKQEGFSTANPEEAALLFKHLATLIATLTQHYNPAEFPSIAVVSPYSRQIELLRDHLLQHPTLKDHRSHITVNSIKVNAVVYFRVIQPDKAVIEVENYLVATSQISQTTLHSVLGQSELDETLSQREKINMRLQQIIDSQTEPWGVKVTHVEVKQIDLPQEMQRAMARQAEAERERRSKVISAEGEFQASQRLSDAAKILSEQPSALTLRYLQTLREIAGENNSTTIFPVPIDLLKPFLKQPDETKS